MRIQEVKKILLGLFMFGFLAGIIYANLFAKTYITSMGIFNDYFLEQYSGVELHSEEYIIYIARIRILPVLLLAILSGTKYKKMSGSVCLLWTGFSGGMILTTSVLKLGMKGIILCLVAVLPHFICYMAAYVMLLIYVFMYPDSRWNSTKTVSMILFLLLGIISECYLNPVLMDIFIRTL